MNTFNNSILDTHALKSFDDFFSKRPVSCTHSRIRGVIVYLATRDGFKEVLTLRHVVVYGTSPGCKKIDREWFRIPKCGEKALLAIDEWLSSLNLHRGMKL